MQAGRGVSPLATGAIAVLAVVAGLGWWQAVNRDNELDELRRTTAATEAQLGAKASALEQRLADTVAAGGELTQLEEQIAAATSKLNERMGVLKDREQALAAVETSLQVRKDELASLDERLAEGGKRLNARLRALAERERELVEIDRRLHGLRAEQAASEARFAEIQSRIGQRLTVLSERERTLADAETKARLASHRVLQLEAEAARLAPRLQAIKAELGQADVELVARQRAADESWARVAKARQALNDLRQLVSQ